MANGSDEVPRYAVESRNIDYRGPAGEALVGYYARPNAHAERRPGVLVVHEWWGANQYVHSRARQLAELGYSALAIDMYGGGRQTIEPAQASTWMSTALANGGLLRERFKAGLDLLCQQPEVDPTQIAAIGYCFGGRVVLEMARHGLDLAGVVSFHGLLATENPATPGLIKAKVLVAHGDADSLVGEQELQCFAEEMRAASADCTLKRYSDAAHGFTNPGSPGYQRKADEQSWQDMQVFLQTLFHERA